MIELFEHPNEAEQTWKRIPRELIQMAKRVGLRCPFLQCDGEDWRLFADGVVATRGDLEHIYWHIRCLAYEEKLAGKNYDRPYVKKLDAWFVRAKQIEQQRFETETEMASWIETLEELTA